jgi:DNA-binding CsgD family transcriptional regulator
MSAEVFGRDDELASLDDFIRAPSGPAALAVEGEAGIGKSTLWLAGAQLARGRGFGVLNARPAEAEQGFAHCGLGDLLEPVAGEVLPELPPPRRRTLEAALLMEEHDGVVDAREIAVALRSALTVLAAVRPLLVAIDDIQWLDPSSAHALEFALRRLTREPVLVLVARRVGSGFDGPRLEDVLAAKRLQVGPLSLGAIQSVVQAQLGLTFARPTLLRIHETSGGNPFYAVKLARALGTDVDPTRPLPVPESLEGLVRSRLEQLPERARPSLRLVAALGRAKPTLLHQAGVDDDALEPALDAGVLVLEGGVIRFAHPLLASVLYQNLSGAERRRAHGLLGALVVDPLARARHLALAAVAPDSEVARDLDAAAALASARAAPIAAAELAEHALRLTPHVDDERAHRRTVAAARAQLAAGDLPRAVALARELAAHAVHGPWRAESLLLLADVEDGGGGFMRGASRHDMARWHAVLREALDEAGGEPALQARIHGRLCRSALYTKDTDAAERHARASLELADALGDAAASARALGELATVRSFAAEPDALALAEAACERARSSGDEDAMLSSHLNHIRLLSETGRLAAARSALGRLEQEWGKRSEAVTVWLASSRSILEFHAGNFRLGAASARRHHRLASEYGWDDPAWLWDVAAHAVHRGEFEEARAIAEEGRKVPILVRAASECVLGWIALWSGDAQAAVRHFEEAERVRIEAGQREPSFFWWRADYVEALLELGRLHDAASLLNSWEADAARLGREHMLAQCLRSRGLLAAARGSVDEALTLLEEAAERHGALGDRYGRARALLALGVQRRRARQKRTARAAIEAALAGFEECGSAVWVEKARSELGSIGGRRREQGLTAAERRVAELAAEGRTNREIAAALFLHERTVQTHLSHAYGKLGVRSRTELGRKLDAAVTNVHQATAPADS